MAENFDVSNFIGINSEGMTILQNAKLFVTNVVPRKEYVNGKATDNVVGSNVTVEFDRHQKYVGSFVVATDLVLNAQDWIDKDVNVSISEVKIYSRTKKNSSYSTVEVSLHGNVSLASDNVQSYQGSLS